MPIDAELIADRRRLRRKLSFWRVLGVVAEVGGFILADQSRMRDLFRRVAEARNVSGVVIAVNSPGGTTTGAEELFRGIRQLAEKKPLVAFVDGTAASGGYITALGADHIVARETALVGSIGVLFQYPDVSRLLNGLGVRVEEIKSAPLKAEPSPFHPTSPEARAALQEIVGDTFDWFKRLVAERRRMDEGQLAAVSSGRVFNGRQGVGLKLVDELGGEREAVAWLEREKGVAKDLPVREWKPRTRREFDLWTAASLSADLLGFDSFGEKLRRAGEQAKAANLDGLLALWHPAIEK